MNVIIPIDGSERSELAIDCKLNEILHKIKKKIKKNAVGQ